MPRNPDAFASRRDPMHRHDLPYLFLLGGLGLLCFAEALIGPGTLYGGDFILYFLPQKEFVYEQVRSHGGLPFWNPFLFSGIPFVTNIQASMFYPPALIYYLLPPASAYEWSTVLHVMLGSLFMYFFMRDLGTVRAAAFLAAVVFSYNGYFMAHLYAGHLTFVQTYVWIPLVFGGVRRLAESRRLVHALWGGAALGLQILGGFPQVAFYTILAVLAYGLYRSGLDLRDKNPAGAIRTAGGALLVPVVGFALAAVQVLPTLEFSTLSTRAGGVSYAMATYDSLHPKEVLRFLLPDLFGNVVDDTYWWSPEAWHFWETCAYVGILPFLLAVIRSPSNERARDKRFFVLLLLGALFLALGKHNPIYSLVAALPGFRSFRIPAQILFLYVFGFSVIAGFGMHRLQQGHWQWSRAAGPVIAGLGTLLVVSLVTLHLFPGIFYHALSRFIAEGPVFHENLPALFARTQSGLDRAVLLFFSTLGLLVLWKRGRMGKRTLQVLLPAVLILDLYLVVSPFVQPWGPADGSEQRRIARRLPSSAPQGRVLPEGSVFASNDGMQYRFPSILGYDPLMLGRYLRFVLASQGEEDGDNVVHLTGIRDGQAKLLKMLNLRYRVSKDRIETLENEIPYAQVVHQGVFLEEAEALEFMQQEGFDPMQMVVLDPADEAALEPFVPLEQPGGRTPLRVLDYGLHGIRLEVVPSQPGFLVLSEIHYPGWTARVNGRPVPVVRGNALFRTIPVGSGRQEVLLEFISWPFRVGAGVSVGTLALCVFLWVRCRKGNRVKQMV